MALLREGSGSISEENLNSRLVRECAETGAITASLAWNDASDLDLRAKVILAKGGAYEIYYKIKQAVGGTLDIDMHAKETEVVPEPVENIFWKRPPAGDYSISVHLYAKRGTAAQIPFCAFLKRDGHDGLSQEGALCREKSSLEVFRFTVDEKGEVAMGRPGTDLPNPVPAAASHMRAPPSRTRVKKSMKAMKVMTITENRPRKCPKIAHGKKAMLQVYQGKRLQTKGGLKKEHLIKSKDGKIVSAKKSKAGRESKWARATAKARAVKGYVGFKAIKRGSSFHTMAMEMMADF